MGRKRQISTNYALKGDFELEFWAPSDNAALARAQNEVSKKAPVGTLCKLFFKGPAVDELLFFLEKTDKVLCVTKTASDA